MECGTSLLHSCLAIGRQSRARTRAFADYFLNQGGTRSATRWMRRHLNKRSAWSHPFVPEQFISILLHVYRVDLSSPSSELESMHFFIPCFNVSTIHGNVAVRQLKLQKPTRTRRVPTDLIDEGHWQCCLLTRRSMLLLSSQSSREKKKRNCRRQHSVYAHNIFPLILPLFLIY